uniref:Uncharacterized protein n=1 Tax=Cacopsylla melanoneura TaxID=428564 RepID=A0A8D8UBA3_9HEMI
MPKTKQVSKPTNQACSNHRTIFPLPGIEPGGTSVSYMKNPEWSSDFVCHSRSKNIQHNPILGVIPYYQINICIHTTKKRWFFSRGREKNEFLGFADVSQI